MLFLTVRMGGPEPAYGSLLEGYFCGPLNSRNPFPMCPVELGTCQAAQSFAEGNSSTVLSVPL